MLKRINLRSLLLKSHISFSEMQKFSSTFLSATNATYIEHIYSQWLSDPSSVHSSWHAYFLNEAKDLPSEQSFSLPNQLSQFTFTQ
jgi:2-oxoglutarate dehydrogenase E1 component